MSLSLRRAGPADAPAVAAVVAAAYAPHAARMGRPPAPMLADHAADIAHGAVWVAERHGAVVAAMTLRAEVDGALLDSVAAAPPGGGAGGALLALAERRAAGGRLRLYTHASMVENQAWHRRRGFAEVPAWEVSDYDRVYFEKRCGTGGCASSADG